MAEHGGIGLKARPTIYKGIQMRSRLEAGFAAWLDQRHVRWSYEPRAFAHPDLGQYLPDFQIENEGRAAFVEVKPQIPREVDATRWASIIGYSVEPCFLVIATPERTWLKICRPVVTRGLIHAEWVASHDHGWTVLPTLSTRLLPWAGEWWKGADT